MGQPLMASCCSSCFRGSRLGVCQGLGHAVEAKRKKQSPTGKRGAPWLRADGPWKAAFPAMLRHAQPPSLVQPSLPGPQPLSWTTNRKQGILSAKATSLHIRLSYTLEDEPVDPNIKEFMMKSNRKDSTGTKIAIKSIRILE